MVVERSQICNKNVSMCPQGEGLQRTLQVASSEAVRIRQRGKVPSPIAIAVMGRVWSVRVAKGVGGSMGVALRSLQESSEASSS